LLGRFAASLRQRAEVKTRSTPSDIDEQMLQSTSKSFLFALLVALLCAGTTAYAQDDIISRGIETFRETCLMGDPHSERIYQWATDKGLKIIQGQGPEHAGAKLLRWEVAKSGDTTLMLQVRVNDPAYLNCSVYFDQQRDSNRLVETFFLNEMRQHSHARQQRSVSSPDQSAYSFMDGKDLYTYFDGRQSEQDKPHIFLAVAAALPPPDVALPRTFATPERSYQLFVNACLARFPDIKNIGDYVMDLGWKSAVALRTGPFYSGLWNLYDPFDEMSPYSFELKQSNVLRLCTLGFDVRAAVPMDRLIQTYALVRVDDPYPSLHRPDEKFEFFSGQVAGKRVLFSLRTVPVGHYGDLSASVETPQ
jgi:hypothetical protein